MSRQHEPARPPGEPDHFGPDFLNNLFRNALDPGYADAARKRQAAGAPGRWEQVGGTMLRAVALALVGFLLAVGYLQAVAEKPERTKARAALAEQIAQRESRTDELARRAEQLRDKVARQRDAALSSDEAARLREMEATTGLGRVRGDGIVVRVADAPPDADAVTGEGRTDLGRVFDRDLQDIANALWSAGAEAIAINDHRLTSTSTIRMAGSAIVVDFRPLVGPYEVSAIGPKNLEKRFLESETARLMRRLVTEYGMGFHVRAVDDLTLPAAGEPQLQHARPATTPIATATSTPTETRRSTAPTGGSR